MAIDWKNGTWEPGSRVQYYGSSPASYLDVFPGLYWYSGFGSGTFFRADGTILRDCSPQEASKEAERLSLDFRYVDSFDRCSKY